jgi:hypothetical protein
MVDARVLAGIFVLLVPGAAGQGLPAPQLPFYDWKACPFEYCRYDRWTAQIPVTVYDTWQENRRQVAQIGKGEAVLALTGGVETIRPGVVRMDRDLEGSNLKRGDLILTYADRGEGFSAVWFKGRYYSDFDISFTRWPDGTGCGSAHCAATYVDPGNKVWWAKVELRSGVTGWVNMEETRVNGGAYLLGSTER